MATKTSRIAAAKKMLKNPEGGQWEANQNWKAGQDEMKKAKDKENEKRAKDRENNKNNSKKRYYA
jgi:hypothetical protein